MKRCHPNFERPAVRRRCATRSSLLRGDDRDVAVQLTVDVHGLDDLAPIGLETTVEVVQRDSGRLADGPVEEPGRQRLACRVLSALLPARDQIEALVQLREQLGNLARVVLPVGVQRDDGRAAGDHEAVSQRRRLPEVAPELEDEDVAARGGETLHLGEGPVGGAVVHEEYLVVPRPLHGSLDLREQRRQAVDLVVDRYDERDLRGHG
jgi:hypothetical protein